MENERATRDGMDRIHVGWSCPLPNVSSSVYYKIKRNILPFFETVPLPQSTAYDIDQSCGCYCCLLLFALIYFFETFSSIACNALAFDCYKPGSWQIVNTYAAFNSLY